MNVNKILEMNKNNNIQTNLSKLNEKEDGEVLEKSLNDQFIDQSKENLKSSVNKNSLNSNLNNNEEKFIE